MKDLDGVWLSREAIDLVSAIEGYNAWDGFEWTQMAQGTGEHEWETAFMMVKRRPE